MKFHLFASEQQSAVKNSARSSLDLMDSTLALTGNLRDSLFMVLNRLQTESLRIQLHEHQKYHRNHRQLSMKDREAHIKNVALILEMYVYKIKMSQ